ncbi:MAG: hypothetical protein A2101_05005 [Spirochaetes bacterium GWF2_52_7]|nr:MAG: hypothetical protein A2101_05005 [Spirochaetes bacterium GWF2_52_7]
MSVRTIIVTLENETGDEWAERLCQSILVMRGVLAVTAEEISASDYWAIENARQKLGQKLWDVLYPKNKKGA